MYARNAGARKQLQPFATAPFSEVNPCQVMPELSA